MAKGKKECPSCNLIVGASLTKCGCGFAFQKKIKPPKKPFFKERRDFIKRMLDGSKSKDFTMDFVASTKVFAIFKNDIDFLSKVKPPFKFDGSIKWLISKDGLAFLNAKYREFNFKVKDADICLDLLIKVGEDIVEEKNKNKSIRNFLNDE